jgi:Fe-S oxidoreductase
VELAEKNMAENRRQLRELGVKTVFTSCAGCAKQLKHNLGKEFTALHAVEFIDQMMATGKIKIEKELPKTVIYHDGCDLGRHSGVYEAPRNILKRIPGVQLLEFPHNRQKADCCGGPFMAPYPQMAQELAAARVQAALDQGAEILVTACPSCIVNFKNGQKLLGNNSIEVQDLMLLLQRLVRQK